MKLSFHPHLNPLPSREREFGRLLPSREREKHSNPLPFLRLRSGQAREREILNPLSPGGRELERGGRIKEFHPHLNPLPSREREFGVLSPLAGES